MTNEEYVLKLQKRENELLKICLYHNISRYESNDIIQDTYIKLLRFQNIDKYLTNGEPNMYIVFMIVRNAIYDYRKKEHKLDKVEITENILESVEYEENEETEENVLTDLLGEWLSPRNKNKYIINKILTYDFIQTEINKIEYWFDRTIIKLYIFHNHSVASLAKETTLSQTLIKKIVVEFRKNCAVSLQELKNQKQ